MSHKKNRERNDLVDIWGIFNPSEKRYSWRQKSPTIHCRLDFFNYICYITRKTCISYGIKKDHSFFVTLDRQTTIFINLKHLFSLKYQLTNCYSMIQQQTD